MESKESPAPITFSFVVLPFGISNGYLGVTLPFVLTKAGFSVATAGAIVVLGLSANLCNFLWAPAIDLTLSLRRWYLIGLAACVSTLFLLGIMPLRQDSAIMLTAVAFLAQVGSTNAG
jgi:MFS transporter, PAT family, beta-lactamase induction signal transducer AmpG